MTQPSEIMFVKILLPFMLGILIGYDAAPPLSMLVTGYLCILLVIVLIICSSFYIRGRLYRHKQLLAILTYLLAFGSALFLTNLNKEDQYETYFANLPARALLVRISDEPQIKHNTIKFRAAVIRRIDKGKAIFTTGHMLVTIKLNGISAASYKYGDELLIPGVFNDIQEAHNPYQFDVKPWLALQNIYTQCYLEQDLVIKTGHNNGNKAIAGSLNLRRKQVDVYQKYIKSQEAFSIASTLILGYRADLSAETLSAYSKTGTIHALSVSGMHVGIIYLVLNFGLAFMDLRKAGKFLKVVLIIGLIWFYALLTGLSPSVLRSVIMLTVYILAKSLRKDINTYNLVACSAFCILAYNPFLLFDLGAQLSYISVLGLVFLQPRIKAWFNFRYKLANQLWAATALSLAAQITTFPLAVFYFHQFPIYFLISNLFITLPVAALMYLGLFILIFGAYFLMPAFDWIIRFTNGGLKLISTFPLSTLDQIWINGWELALLSALTAFLIFTLIKPHKFRILCTLLCLLSMLSFRAYHKLMITKRLEIVFFSLPRDYATAIIQQDHATLISSLNPNSAAYRFYVKPMLDQAQVKTIKFLGNHQDYQTKYLQIKQHQISFSGKSILIADSCFNHLKPSNIQKFDLLLLSGSSRLNLAELVYCTRPNKILIDGTNKLYAVKKYEELAKNFNVPSYNLKKLKAYLVNINK
jgi:competence protein ComEC